MFIKRAACRAKIADSANVRDMDGINQDLLKQVQEELVGHILIPVYPHFVPWESVPSLPKGATGRTIRRWRKVGTILEKDSRMFNQKIPVLILEAMSEENISRIMPMSGHMAEMTTKRKNEIWLKCLWSEMIVYHRVNDTNIFLLKQQLMDNF